MDSLNKQINTLEKEYNYYEETINLRKKQFHTLLVSADEILYSIKQNREGKEYDWIKSIDEMTEDLSQDDESEIDENEDDKEDGMLEEKGIFIIIIYSINGINNCLLFFLVFTDFFFIII